MRLVLRLILGAGTLVASCGDAESLFHRGDDAGAGIAVVTGGGPSGGSGPGGDSRVGGSGGAGVASGGAGGQGGQGNQVVAPRDAGSEAGAGGVGGPASCAGGALLFDGADDFLEVDRQIQDDFTIEGWIKTAARSSTGTVFSDGDGLFYANVVGRGNDFAVALLNDKLVFSVGSSVQIESASDVTTGRWVHVAVTRARGTGVIAVIVDGVAESSVRSMVTGALGAPSSVTFGGNNPANRYFAGVMDEVRIWSVARSLTQIRSTMHRLVAGTEPGLVGYWRFDESGGATAADLSPSGNTARGDAAAATAPAHVASDAPLCP